MASLEPFFLPIGGRRRFCLHHAPDAQKACDGAIVYVHPFAEEMNKSRRVAAIQARALAAAGFNVLQIDLCGCGDSEGAFGDVGWNGWVDDVCEAATWMRARFGAPWLWGLRTGALLAAAAAARLADVPGLLHWQPVLSGRQYVQQFLRIKIAESLFGGSEGRVDTGALRARIRGGETLEVAGYALTPGLVGGMEASELPPPPKGCSVVWIEVGEAHDATLAPASASRIAEWRAAGVVVDASVAVGEPFWRTTEIAECPDLIDRTLNSLARKARWTSTSAA